MLILAGVSISAIVGDNGVLTKTTYASFLSEMSAVEEAVQLWKAGEIIEAQGDEVKAIPANGLCRANDLISAERLVGEVGYYRVWSLTSTMPTTDILSSADNFNSSFESELVFYPAGVQDLYYLNNEALEIKGNKTYLIDATTGMIFSMTGISLKGVRCYSLNMARAVMNGTIEQPLFAEAEVSGTGDNIVYAGQKYLVDKNGNYIDEKGNIVDEENRVENPNGFQIIASNGSKNVFKLYNTGDLYGKGLKGIQLNTSVEEMDKISPYIWKDVSIPNSIGGYKYIYSTNAGLFLIDNSDDIWSIGNNYGLTDNQRIEYTGREWLKIDLGKNASGTSYKAKKIFGTGCAVFVITTTNELLATGINEYGQLGTGDRNERTTFTLISGINNPNSIQLITGANYSNEGGSTIIKCVDEQGKNHFYLCGTDVWGGLGYGVTKGMSTNNSFIEIFQGVSGRGNKIADDIANIYEVHHESVVILFKNGQIHWTGWNYFHTPGTWAVPKVVDVRVSKSLIVMKCDNNGTTEYWGSAKGFVLGEGYNDVGVKKIDVPSGISITDFDITNDGAAYFLTTTGDVYGMGMKSYFGNKDDYKGWTMSGMEKLSNISNVDSFFGIEFDVVDRAVHGQLFLKKNNQYYLTNNTSIMYGNDILQKTWVKVASNVLYFDATNCAYITNDHNLYVAGTDSRQLGLGTISETLNIIDNYTLVTQPEIAGKAEKVYHTNTATYVLTTDNKLYGTGLSSTDEGRYCYCGWDENKSVYIEIMDNVKYFMPADGFYRANAVITTDGKLYAWGDIKLFIGQNSGATMTPTEFAFPTAIGSVDNIKKWLGANALRSFILGNDGKVYMAGNSWEMYQGGFPNKKKEFEEFTYGITLNADEKFVDIANIGANNCIMLTDSGRIFGFGNACYLGIGRRDTTLTSNQLIQSGVINGKKITQIVSGDGFYLAVDNEGKVYGTGNNLYGVLGRWKGSNRNQPNSRYRTAYDWVECPELEI